jgi:hypothetical protein
MRVCTGGYDGSAGAMRCRVPWFLHTKPEEDARES